VQELFATESDRAVTEAENQNRLGWFCSPESYALSSVGDSARFLLCPGVDVLFPDNFEVGESDFCDDLFELCFQQGTGNSASPNSISSFAANGLPVTANDSTDVSGTNSIHAHLC
jgi:hypothetical protein